MNHLSVLVSQEVGMESFVNVTGNPDSASVIKECIRKIIYSELPNFNHFLAMQVKEHFTVD